MSVFDGKIKTKSRTPYPHTDHKLIPSGFLSYTAINEEHALRGTKGKHCDLVHGDHWNEIEGCHNENIGQDQTIKVVGKHKETLVESCYQNIIGPQIVLNNNVRNETRLNKFTLVYGSNCMCQTSDGDQNVKPTDYSVITVADFEYDTLKLEIVTVHAEIVGAHGEVVACHAEAKLFHAETNAIHFASDGFSNQDRAAEAEMKLVKDSISANRFSTELIFSDLCEIGAIARTLQSQVGAEAHTGPAVFGLIAGPGIL
jgi:hypothetical protein